MRVSLLEWMKEKWLTILFIAVVFFMGMDRTALADGMNSSYYDQLSDAEKVVYDHLKDISYSGGEISFEWPENMSFTAADDAQRDQKFEQIKEVLQVSMQGVLDALLKDNPHLYWLDPEQSKYSWGYSGVQEKEGTRWSMKPINYVPVAAYTPDQIAQVELLIGRAEITGENRYEKLKSIHDYLCNTVTYDHSLKAEGTHSPYGALVNKVAVCEGYALTFKWLCDREGIPSSLVIGDSISPDGERVSHMWNYVQMEDGRWYAVDVTWDDQTETQGIFYDYFLAGFETVASSEFGGRKFSDTHVPSGDFSGTGYKNFSYPDLNPGAYAENTSASADSQPFSAPEETAATALEQPLPDNPEPPKIQYQDKSQYWTRKPARIEKRLKEIFMPEIMGWLWGFSQEKGFLYWKLTP